MKTTKIFLIVGAFALLAGNLLGALSPQDQKSLGELIPQKKATEVKAILTKAGNIDAADEQRALRDFLILAALPGVSCDGEIIKAVGSAMKNTEQIEGSANLATLLACPNAVRYVFIAMSPKDSKLFSERLLLTIDEESEDQRHEVQEPRGESNEEKKSHMVEAATTLEAIAASFRWTKTSLAAVCKKGFKESCEISKQYVAYSKAQKLRYESMIHSPGIKTIPASSQKEILDLLFMLYGPFFK